MDLQGPEIRPGRDGGISLQGKSSESNSRVRHRGGGGATKRNVPQKDL